MFRLLMVWFMLLQSSVAVRADAREDCETTIGDAAIAACNEAIRKNPLDAQSYNNRGIEYYKKGDSDRAIADFTKAAEVDPKFVVAYENRGRTFVALGRREEAIADFQRALSINPSLQGIKDVLVQLGARPATSAPAPAQAAPAQPAGLAAQGQTAPQGQNQTPQLSFSGQSNARGWLGLKIQKMTDEIGDVLGVEPARGALVVGVSDKGPAEAAGIQFGDVIIRFDDKEIKDARDLPRMVTDTPIGKEVEVVVLRQGREEGKTVRVGRLGVPGAPDGKEEGAPGEKADLQQMFGLSLSDLTTELRQRYQINNNITGVVITGVDENSAAAERRLNAGDVIVEVAREPVSSVADVQKWVDQLKKSSRKSMLFVVADAKGNMRFVALSLQ